jgi:hypothetical protein
MAELDQERYRYRDRARNRDREDDHERNHSDRTQMKPETGSLMDTTQHLGLHGWT